MGQSRYVVVDLNALDAGLSEFIKPADQIVLTHVIAIEMAESNRFDKHTVKFPKWLKARGEQIWVAHEWGTLVDRERSCRDRTVGLAWRDDQTSRQLTQAAHSQDTDWRNRFVEIKHSEGRKILETGRQYFVRFCQHYSEDLKGRDPDSVRRLVQDFEKEATETVRMP